MKCCDRLNFRSLAYVLGQGYGPLSTLIVLGPSTWMCLQFDHCSHGNILNSTRFLVNTALMEDVQFAHGLRGESQLKANNKTTDLYTYADTKTNTYVSAIKLY